MMPPKPCLASRRSSQISQDSPASSASCSACSASHCGDFRLDGTVASIRERQPAPPSSRPRSRAAAWSLPDRPARTTRRTGSCSGPCERQWKTNEPSIVPTTYAVSASGRHRRATAVATDSWSNVARADRRAGAPEVRGLLVAEPDEQDQAEVSRAGDRNGDHLAAGALGPASDEDPRAGRAREPQPASAAPDTEHRRAVVDGERQREHLDPRELVGWSALSANAGGETWGGRGSGRDGLGGHVSPRPPSSALPGHRPLRR